MPSSGAPPPAYARVFFPFNLLRAAPSSLFLSANAVYAQAGANRVATQVPCVICSTNPQRAAVGASHDAARCRVVKTYADSPHLVAQKGYATLQSLGLPPADELLKLGYSLGPMRNSRSSPPSAGASNPNGARSPSANSATPNRPRSPSAGSSNDRFKRSASPSSQPYSNARARGNSQPNSRTNSRPTTPTTSRPNSPGAQGRDRSSGRERNPRDPFLAALTNPAYMAMVKAAIEKSVDAAMNERK